MLVMPQTQCVNFYVTKTHGQSVKFYVSYASVCQNFMLATLQSVKCFMLANLQGVFY
jgi:hypothetical protein